jgi:hypothetical protein
MSGCGRARAVKGLTLELEDLSRGAQREPSISDREPLSGLIERVTFYNPDNGCLRLAGQSSWAE